MKNQKSCKTLLMGVLNVTPDSFSDGGRFFDASTKLSINPEQGCRTEPRRRVDKDNAVARALEMEKEGADIIDVGGESTRPGAKPVGQDEESARVVPVIEGIRKVSRVAISIDTRNAAVAEAAIKAGAGIINDVSGLRNDRDMAGVAAKYGCSLVLMHMKGKPENMQDDPRYTDIIAEISESLKTSIAMALSAGVLRENIIVDPGIGFGKTVEHNLEILRRLDEFRALGFPVCIGTSRKSFIGKILNSVDVKDRLMGTIATCVIAVINSASILRVHDVKEVREAIAITDIILERA